MKQIIPFKKDIIMKSRIAEMTSISIEHDLKLNEDDTVSGDFIISGDYKMTEASINKEPFSHKIPFEIILDTSYDESTFTIDINDFYYEIINNDVLRVNIEVSISGEEKRDIYMESEDKMEELFNELEADIKENAKILDLESIEEAVPVFENIEPLLRNNVDIIEEVPIERTESVHVIDEVSEIITEKQRDDKEINVTEIKSLFDSLDDNDDRFSTYHVHIVREGEILDEILKKYNVTREEVDDYNDLENIMIGVKLIIPSTKNE